METINKAADMVARTIYGDEKAQQAQARTPNPTEHMICDSATTPSGDHTPTKGPGTAIHPDKPIATTTSEISNLTENQPTFKNLPNRGGEYLPKDTLRHRRDSGHAEVEGIQQRKEVENSNTSLHGHERKDDSILRTGGDMEGLPQQQFLGHETHGDGINRTGVIGDNNSTDSATLSGPAPQNKDSAGKVPHMDFGCQGQLPKGERIGSAQGDTMGDRKQEEIESTQEAQTRKLGSTATTISDGSRIDAKTPPDHSHAHAKRYPMHDPTTSNRPHAAESGIIDSEDSNLANETRAKAEEPKYQDGDRHTQISPGSLLQLGTDPREHGQAKNEIGIGGQEGKIEKGEVGKEKAERSEKMDEEGERGQDKGEEKKAEPGHLWIKSNGVAAEGGDFDAAKAGAAREADRLLEQAGVRRSLDPKEREKEITGTNNTKSGHKGTGAVKGEMGSKQHEDSATTEGGKHHGLHLPKFLHHHNDTADQKPHTPGQGTSEIVPVSGHKGLGEKLKEKVKLHKE